jgi:uridine phosphorylase
MTYPLLEHEFDCKAKIEPSRIVQPRDIAEYCVISFFREIIEKVAAEKQAKTVVENRWEDGRHPIYEMEHCGQRIAFYHPGVGAPISAALLEEAIAFGCRKFVAVGGAGVLEKGEPLGKLILVTATVRDEGTSYHYLPPAREVHANQEVLRRIEDLLRERRLPFRKAKTWTTDAPYRETPSTINLRRAEGCLTVEMEAAALMAVSQFRNAPFGQILYAGDDLSGDQWDNRGWQSRAEIRESLFWLGVEACMRL